MKLRIMLFSVLMLSVFSGITIAQDVAKWSDSQKFSYILGSQIGSFSKQSELEVDVEMFTKGLNDMTNGGELALSQTEINLFMASL